MKAKPHLISVQGQTRCALFGRVYGEEYSLPPESSGVLEDAPLPSTEGDLCQRDVVCRNKLVGFYTATGKKIIWRAHSYIPFSVASVNTTMVIFLVFCVPLSKDGNVKIAKVSLPTTAWRCQFLYYQYRIVASVYNGMLFPSTAWICRHPDSSAGGIYILHLYRAIAVFFVETRIIL